MYPAVVHVVPSDEIGGVETAARSICSGAYLGFSFSVYYVRPLSENTPRATMSSKSSLSLGFASYLRHFIDALRWLHRKRPRLLIASLWRSYAILLAYKLLHPCCKTVAFLHSSRSVHLVDWLSAFGAMAVATEIWVDSEATLKLRVPIRWQAKGKVISFVLQRLKPVTLVFPSPTLFFWGRLSSEKGLDRAVLIIDALRLIVKDVHFCIIGPDNGERSRIELMIDRLQLENVISLVGPKNHKEIAELAAKGSFYLQTSVFEGAAMSVIEAMQLGLVPIVTPVGDIANYCHDSINALLVDSSDLKGAANRIKLLLDDPVLYAKIREKAIYAWTEFPIYSEDLLRYSRNLLSV